MSSLSTALGSRDTARRKLNKPPHPTLSRYSRSWGQAPDTQLVNENTCQKETQNSVKGRGREAGCATLDRVVKDSLSKQRPWYQGKGTTLRRSGEAHPKWVGTGGSSRAGEGIAHQHGSWGEDRRGSTGVSYRPPGGPQSGLGALFGVRWEAMTACNIGVTWLDIWKDPWGCYMRNRTEWKQKAGDRMV